MDSDGEDVMATLMDEELAVAAATRDAVGDDEHLAILISLFAMIVEEDKPIIGGSAPGHRKSKPREMMEGYCMLYADYFANDPLHGDAAFRRRFRMSRKLFLKIVENLREIDYFKLKRDAIGELGCGFTDVLLARDNKNICRTKVYDVPNRITIPFVWPIMKFMRMDQYQQNDFLKFSLHPDPENDYQAKEWGIFMRFLRENKKAGVVEFRSITFHILAPESHSYYAEVFYETVLKDPGVCRKMEGKSGRSNTSEETCDNIRHTKEMQSLHKLHRFVPESSTCDSIEDGPRVLDPAVKNKTSTLASNFVKTSPSYLRTLSQTHAGWIFGAIAELIDNSRDASASRLDISIQSMFSKKAGGKVPVLCVFDSGHGMTYHQMMKMVLFGHDRPNEHRQDQIGRFGIGFKTGAMKLGKDALVLTQTSTSRSMSFLSQSFNESKTNLEIPVVAYCKKGQYMEFDLNVQSEAAAEYNLNAIKDYSPFNEYVIGEKVCLFGEEGTGTQIFIWNLDRWGKEYTLQWNSEKTDENPVGHDNRDILIRSKRVRSRPGQTSSNVPLDYSLKAYLEVIFLNPQMKVTVQGSPSYKRVGGQKHNAVTGRGIIGVADITDLIDDEDGNTWVLNSKQGFQDCEMYAKLEEWLGRKTDEYWNTNFDNLELVWMFCHMEPFNGNCDIPEEELEVAVITVAEKISGHNKVENFRQDEDVKNVRLISPPTHSKGMSSSDSTICEGEGDVSVRVFDDLSRCRHYHSIDFDEDNETISSKNWDA
ncbi:uncharacterized protein LOC124648322 [Lolium rigidum]|uniref:uncharacterized protein LOC124648322 n=1 Tax=Lolium rigidum TaxID=89674 RepID=UPI001F5C51CD|nr:uncharacterized protein LOC124648322 [Lolium rigidum]